MLTLHLLQSALVLVNTRLVDLVLDDPQWPSRLTAYDVHGLSPLFWSNVALHGTFTSIWIGRTTAPRRVCPVLPGPATVTRARDVDRRRGPAGRATNGVTARRRCCG
ncbi:hypothetical protein Sya03_57550 [Spirilliplanes yamanashiensis]|uniref:Tn3 transposase DDE domain-containing protein n=2 Tax=Spirilliplanes yamanashiensis TaxID=42233 RepID=A0A8J4DMG3_9ACTN|nr:hypothetical protein Sya03_57550 [Spirilliplanes yamanashiensis]